VGPPCPRGTTYRGFGLGECGHAPTKNHSQNLSISRVLFSKYATTPQTPLPRLSLGAMCDQGLGSGSELVNGGILDSLFETLPMGLAMLNEAGRIVRVNEEAKRLLGFTKVPPDGLTYEPAPAVVLRADGQLLCPDGFPCALALREKVEIRGEEVGFRDAAGNVTWVCVTAIPIPGSGVLVCYQDVTERRRAEETPVRDAHDLPTGLPMTALDTREPTQLEERLLQAQRMESLGSLAGGVAHDMNNILGAILGIASALADTDEGDGERARDYDTIIQACLRGRTMVRGLLDFTRQELVNWHRLDLNLLIEEQLRLIERTLPTGIVLKVELSPNLAFIKGDPNALVRALLNLITNAMDALGTQGHIRISTCNHSPNLVELCVADNGPGMPKEIRDKALEPFFTTKPIGKGTGLGLAIVYGTVKAHRGQLELTSKLGEGTQVTLRFPAEQKLSTTPPRDEHPANSIYLKDLLVLLVDDDALVTSAVSSLLRGLGHRVVTAPNGQEALVVAENTPELSVVILDLNMPVLDGHSTLPRLRALYPKLPVIIATGRDDQEARELSRTFANVSILPKPFSLQELRSELEVALSAACSSLPLI
jgi:signal transduction histidine kinase/CheY-like chemotaxis protein